MTAVTLLAFALFGQTQTPISGTVINETNSEPQPRVLLTLIGFAGGMSPIEEVHSGTDGSFIFQKSLPVAPPNQPMQGMLRAEFEGASYSELIRVGMQLSDLRVSVYEVSGENIPAPDNRVMIFEPGTGEMVVTETFLYNNTSQPPRTFRDAKRGTLRFYLPPAAHGAVQVSLRGPSGMPLPSSADQTNESDIYKVDFPLKPGKNRIDLSYRVPYEEGNIFETRVLYSGLSTRIAVSAGVIIASESLIEVGVEPRTQATLFETSSDAPLQLTISGQGRLIPPARSESESAEGREAGGSLQIEPPPIEKELVWILALACCILGVGFYHLLTNPRAPADVSAVTKGPNPFRPQMGGRYNLQKPPRKG